MKRRKNIHLGEYKMLGYQNVQDISYYLKTFIFPWWAQGQTRHDMKYITVKLEAYIYLQGAAMWAAI